VLLTAWALVAVALYVIAGIRKDVSSAEGAAKYAIMGVASSSLMLYGIAIMFSSFKTTNLSLMEFNITKEGLHLLIIGLLLLIASFGFKLGVVPFHGWLLDVYGGVHPILVSYIAGVVKISGIIAILRVLYPFSTIIGNVWFSIFAILSIATMTFGNIVALLQDNVQRIMAYSSIAQAGYILVGFASASTVGYKLGLEGIALHIITYMLAKIGIFVALAYMVRRGVDLTFKGISGLGRRMPVISLSITILVLSLMGVPPFIGFWSKFLYLFLSVLPTAPWLTLIAAINSGISVGYYAQIIRYLYFVEPQTDVKEYKGDAEVIISLITAILSIILGLGPAIMNAPYLTL